MPKKWQDAQLFEKFVEGSMKNYLTTDEVDTLVSKISLGFPEIVQLFEVGKT